jgi:hypothetical protein
MKKLFFAIAFLTAAARLHSIPGDLNEDGKLNIADQVMLNAMIENRLAQTNAADLNFDDKVDNADMELLTAAVIYGKPLPQRLDSIYLNEYASDWSVSGGGLTLDIPGYCSRQRTVSLTTMPEPPDFDIDLQDNLMTPPVIVFGMQGEPLTEEAIFTLDVPPEHNDAAGKPMLLLGSPANSPHRKTTLWSYRVIPAEEEFGVTYTNRKLVWKPDLRNSYGYETAPVSLSVIYRTTATRAEPTPQPTRADDFTFEKLDYLTWYGVYRTNHFVIELHTSAPEAQVRQLAKDLEEAYDKIGEQGMPRLPDFARKWTNAKRIWVNINKNPIQWNGRLSFSREKGTDAYCNEPGWFSAPYIDVPEGVLTYGFRAETCCHELFHYHQYYYANHYSAIFLDEMAGSTAEYFVTPNRDSYDPDNHTFARAPINGLYRYSSKLNQNGSNHHGYNLTPFGTWLTFVKYKDRKFWPAVFSSSGYSNGDGMSALKQAVRTMNSEGSLAADYKEFIYDYFTLKPGIGYENRNLYSFFIDSTTFVQDPKIDRYKQNGFRAVFKSANDFFKEANTRHTFSIQNFGAATMLIEFWRDSLFLKDYPNALVTFSLPKDSSKSITDFKLFAVVGIEKEIMVTNPEELIIDSEANTASLLISLEKMPRPMTNMFHGPYIGLVAAYANDSEPDDGLTSINMSVDFIGPIIANGLLGWFCDYVPKQEAKATADLTITPSKDTAFVGAEFDIFETAYQEIRTTEAMTHLAIKSKDVMFNITGFIHDATATIEDPSTIWRAEYTGNIKFVVSKTKDGVYNAAVYHQELLFDGKNYKPLTNYNPLTGNGAKPTDFLPDAKSKRSNFYLKIPDFDHDAALYNVSIHLPYLEYQKGENVSFSTRDVQILNFTIYPAKKNSEYIITH